MTATTRTETKKVAAKKLRAAGKIPAIFYGPQTKAMPLVIDSKELARTLQTEAGENVLIDLDLREGDLSRRTVVMVKDIQLDPLKNVILHADFYEVSMDVMVNVEVPIHLVGKPEGVKVGGILDQVRRVLEVQCLPGDIPKNIDVDVSGLKIGDSIHVEDLRLGKVKILSDANLTIATVVPPGAEEKKVVEEVAPEAVVEAEAKETKEEEEK